MGIPRELCKLLLDPGAVIRPFIETKAVEKVEAHIADTVKKSAKVVTGRQAQRARRHLFRRAGGSAPVRFCLPAVCPREIIARNHAI